MLARSICRTSIRLTLLAILALTSGAAISAQPAVGQADVQAATDDSDASFRSSPVMFIENAGQWDDVKGFQVRGNHNFAATSSSLAWYVWGPGNLADIAVLSASDAWGVGSNGMIQHWNGQDWIQVASPVSAFLNAVAFTSPSDGWAVGNGGTIIRWNGLRWQAFSSGPPNTVDLKDVAMLSPNRGWAVGVKGWWSGSAGSPLMLSWDGSAWREVALPASVAQNSDHALESAVVASPAIPSPNSLDSITMVSQTDGWVVGAGGRIYRWNGASWSRISSPTTSHLHSVSLSSANDGWVVGGNLYGLCRTMLHWNGSTWRVETCPVSEELLDVSMVSPIDGWAVGYKGTILHWDGIKWTAASTPTDEWLGKVVMVSPSDGWIAGQQNLLRYGMAPVTTYSVSGRVTDASGHGIPGVTVSAGSSSSTTTDANGNYTFTGLLAGTYNISPSRYLYAFSPPSRTVTVPPDATGQDFVQTPIVDLSVNRIEVAQVFVEQNDPISGTPIPLIAEKDTLVRVYVGVSGAASVGGVSARLHIRQPNGTETVDSRPINVWPVQAKQTPDPFSLQDTINFRPATRLLQGNVTFWADVDPENRIPETDENNNTGGQVSKTFEAGKPVRIAWTIMGYGSNPFTAVYPNLLTAASGDKVLRRFYPVATKDVDYFFQPGIPPVVDVKFDTNEHHVFYLQKLTKFWEQVTSFHGWLGGQPDRLYGWISNKARTANGTCGAAASRFGGSWGGVAVGADYCDRSIGIIDPAVIFAHEIGHLLDATGLLHAPGSESDPRCEKAQQVDPNYPTPALYPSASILAHGLDVTSSRPCFHKFSDLTSASARSLFCMSLRVNFQLNGLAVRL